MMRILALLVVVPYGAICATVDTVRTVWRELS